MENNGFKVLTTDHPPPAPDAIDTILGGVAGVGVPASLPYPTPAVVDELEGLEDINKLIPIIGKLIEAEALANGKRAYPTRVLRHQHIIAYMVLNPTATMTQICRFFGISYTTYKNIASSDTFKALAAANKVKTLVAAEINESLKDTLSIAIEVAQQALINKQDPDYALQVLDKTANRLGMGTKQQTNVQINNNVVTPDMIAYARQKRLGNG